MENILNYATHRKIWDKVKEVFLRTKEYDVYDLKKLAFNELGLPYIENRCVGCEVAKQADIEYSKYVDDVNCEKCPLDFEIKCCDENEDSLWTQLSYILGKCEFEKYEEAIIKTMEQIRDCGWKEDTCQEQ